MADEIRRLIVVGELTPGTRLKQSQVAAQFGVSTTPVREAFTILSLQGLVRQDTHRGAIVFAPSAADVSENWDIRIVLETLAVEYAAPQIGDDELASLRIVLEEMREALRGDPQRFANHLNPRFHAAICAAARRPRLLELIASLRDASIAYQALLATGGLPEPYVELVNTQHEEIVAALTARDSQRAAAVLRRHLEASRERVLGYLAERS